MLRRICKSNIKPFQAISNNNNYIKWFSTSDPRFGKYEPGKKEADPQKTLEKEALEANKRYIEKKWLKWNVLTSITLIVFFAFWLTGPSDGEVEEKVEEYNPNKKVSNVLGWKIEVERVQNPKSKFFSKTGHGSMPEPYQMPPPSSTQN